MPNILNLQFFYGENTDAEPAVNRYVPADDVSDWNKVVSVRIHLLVETEFENATPEPMNYIFQQKTFSPENDTDKRIRREYTKTVTLRNRALGLTVTGSE